SGGRIWRGSRRVGDDYARGHFDGHPGRSRKGHERRGSARGKVRWPRIEDRGSRIEDRTDDAIFDFRSSIFFIRLFLFVEQTAFREVLTGYAETHPGQRLQALRADLLAAIATDAVLLILDALKGLVYLHKDLPVVGRLAEEQLLRVGIRSLIRGILRGLDVGFAPVILVASDDASQSSAF